MAALAVLTLKELFENKENRLQYLKPLYISAGITGGICLLFALIGGSLMNFSALSDVNYPPEFLNAIVADRKNMMTSDAWRSFFFIALAAGTLWYYQKKPFQVTYATAIIGLLIFIDLWMVDKRFLNDDSFVSKKQAREIVATPADELILQDKDPNYRVLDLTSFSESRASAFHK